MLDMFPVIPSIGVSDVSEWSRHKWAKDASDRFNEEIKNILSPGLRPGAATFSQRVNDIGHLTGHVLDERDIFVTDDKGILRKLTS